MTRKNYLLALLLPAFAIAVAYAVRAFSQYDTLLFVLFVLWVPVANYLRMRYLGFTGQEMLESLLPFSGKKIRRQMFLED